jgi:hypothetical protein
MNARMLTSLRIIALALLVACATTPAKPTFAPTPYTAEQIRQATAVGRTYEWRREIVGQPATTRVITFTKVTDADAEMSSIDLDAEGKELAPAKVSTSTWEELRQHALFPSDAVQISEETVTVPAGTFDCLKYTVTKGDAEGMTFLFAKSLPGAPVQFYKVANGTPVMTSTLVRHVAGKAP